MRIYLQTANFLLHTLIQRHSSLQPYMSAPSASFCCRNLYLSIVSIQDQSANLYRAILQAACHLRQTKEKSCAIWCQASIPPGCGRLSYCCNGGSVAIGPQNIQHKIHHMVLSCVILHVGMLHCYVLRCSWWLDNVGY